MALQVASQELTHSHPAAKRTWIRTKMIPKPHDMENDDSIMSKLNALQRLTRIPLYGCGSSYHHSMRLLNTLSSSHVDFPKVVLMTGNSWQAWWYNMGTSLPTSPPITIQSGKFRNVDSAFIQLNSSHFSIKTCQVYCKPIERKWLMRLINQPWA